MMESRQIRYSVQLQPPTHIALDSTRVRGSIGAIVFQLQIEKSSTLTLLSFLPPLGNLG